MGFSQRRAANTNATNGKREPTTMGLAFAKAGLTDPYQRLKDIALSAMVRHADNRMAAIDATWAVVQQDRELLIALFDRYQQHMGEIGRVFEEIKREIARQENPGMRPTARQAKVLLMVKTEEAERAREQAEQRAADQAEQERRDREYKEYLASWHKTPLFGVTVGDKPVWQVSAATVRAWLPTQTKKLRAVEMLISGLPDDDRPIEFYRTPQDLHDLWKTMDDGD